MNASQAHLDHFGSRRSTLVAPQGAVATSQPLAASAALERLRTGGNAFDAAVTAAAVLNVVEPTSTGIGGDVFALYRTADGHVEGMQSCGGAPAAATRSAIISRLDDDTDSPEMPFHGPHTVTVPGTTRGWEALLDRYGEAGLRSALQPAIEYAINGYPVTEVIASYWQHADELFTDANARAAYLPNDRPPQAGQLVRLPELGSSLKQIAREGADAFYEGAIAEAIVSTVTEKGGLLEYEDLASFEPQFVEPIAADYRGATIYELPPNNQGPLVLEALRIAEAVGATDYQLQSVDRLHRLIEAMKLAFHDGHHWVTDPDYVSVPTLWSDEWVRDRASRIGETALDVGQLPPPGPRGENADTVLITVGDQEGNLVTVINSLFAGFGSGLVAGETGIALQNRGASFSLDPDHPNVIEPGKRPFHTLIPGIANLGTDDWAAFGVMGGHMQPQGHLQVITQLVRDERPLQPALDHPRWRHNADGTLSVEPRMDPVVQTALVRRGHEVRVETPAAFGGAQIVRRRNGVLSAATEPRKDGTAIGY